MHCPKCSAEVTEQAIYCHKCGERVDGEEQQFSPPPQPDSTDRETDPGVASTVDTDPADRPPAEHGANSFKDAASSRQNAADEPEKELWQGGYSPKAMIGDSCLSGLVTIAALSLAIWVNKPWMWWPFAVAIPALWIFQAGKLAYRRISVRYFLTTQRFIHEEGLFRRVTDRIEIIDMDDIAFEQSLLERFEGVGTIRISSSDRSHPELHMLGIEKVKEVAGMIDDARRAERRRRGLHIESI